MLQLGSDKEVIQLKSYLLPSYKGSNAKKICQEIETNKEPKELHKTLDLKGDVWDIYYYNGRNKVGR
jgi:hypothetical protein